MLTDKTRNATLANASGSPDSYRTVEILNTKLVEDIVAQVIVSIPVRQLDVLLFVPVHIDRKHQLLDG
jgi:hypothetical protein